MNAEGKRSGMAKASLLLGILSLVLFFCGAPAAILAVFLGHIAHRRVREQPDKYTGRGFAIAGFTTGYAGLFLTLLLLVRVLTGIAASEERTLCRRHLQEVGIGFRLWASNHGGEFPFNVPAGEGGTLEFATQAADGFDSNAWQHLRMLSNELAGPWALVCPSDRSKRVVPDLTNLRPENVSYQLHTGTNVDENHPDTVLARCPIHGTVLLCDGSVRQMLLTNAPP
jgi:hypothetical protein